MGDQFDIQTIHTLINNNIQQADISDIGKLIKKNDFYKK